MQKDSSKYNNNILKTDYYNRFISVINNEDL